MREAHRPRQAHPIRTTVTVLGASLASVVHDTVGVRAWKVLGQVPCLRWH